MKRFFDLSLLLLLPMFLFSTLTNEAVTTEPVYSSEAHEVFEVLNAEGVTIMSLKDIQAALDNKEALEEAMMPLCGNVACYTEPWLDRFLSVFGQCGLVAPYDCFDSNDDDCITAADLTFFLANFCN